ncbi:unnamed protein product [Jaminaea pallidilutea]
MAGQDVDMKPKKAGEEETAAKASSSPSPTPPSTQELLLALLRHNLALVHRSVVNLESRFASRALRSLPTVRRKVAEYPDVLARIVEEATEQDSPVRKELLAFLPKAYVPKTYEAPAVQTASKDQEGKKEGQQASASSTAMDVDQKDKQADATKESTSTAKPAPPKDLSSKPSPESQPELDAYLRLVAITLLVDQKKLQQALDLARNSVQLITAANRRSLDHLLAKTAYFLARVIELTSGTAGLASERASLLSLHLTSSLRHDAETTSTVINLLLRSYIVEGNLYDQADKLVARAPFPRAQASNSNIARYEYWVGRIRAVQLNYSEAHQHLQQAIRRGPQPPRRETEAQPSAALEGEKKEPEAAKEPAQSATGADAPLAGQTGAGFLQTAYKFLVVVELLMGDIPERSIFRINFLRRALAPYLEIVQAVRIGDLTLFQQCLTKNTQLFQRDATYSLILRLRHNVIKTGIRMISLSYSRISLLDITRKLGLESEEDAEYIVAKAIRDGVIEAKVDHEKGWMISQERADVYSTEEPRRMFETRIEWCLGLRNESVKAMRYPIHGGKGDDLVSAEKAREREREIAKEIADGNIEDDDDE